MEYLNAAIHALLSVVGGVLGWFFGVGNPALYTLAAFIGIDYVSGIMNAIANKQLSSAVGAKGIFKKVMILAFVGIGHLLDMYVIGSGEALQTAIIFFYLTNEGISIVENATDLGLPIPKKLKDILNHLQDK